MMWRHRSNGVCMAYISAASDPNPAVVSCNTDRAEVRMSVAETAYCASCGGALATDNRDRLCSPCGRRRSAVPPGAPPALWTSDEVTRATTDCDFGELLRAYRRAFTPPVTQTALADWLDLSQGQVSRIESGRTAINDLVKLT